MYKNISYRVLNIGLRLGLGALFSTRVGLGAISGFRPTRRKRIWACSGIVTDQAIPGDSYVIFRRGFPVQDYILQQRLYIYQSWGERRE